MFRHSNLSVWIAATVLCLGASPRAASPQQIDYDALGEEAVEVLQLYLRVDTTNPPGNESRAVEFFAQRLEQEGIAYETAESAPGRGNLWAKLKGGDAPGLVLLHHSDVVPADADHWDTDPFSGEIRDGFLWGRGALDMKTLGIEHFMAFVTLHRSEVTLNRDVLFVVTADEEAGGFFGAGWMVENRPEVFDGVGFLLNEGGSGALRDGRASFSVEVTQKVPLWLELTAVGQPGHGSTPRVDSATKRLLRALYRIDTYNFPPRIVPAVDSYFKALAVGADDFWRPHFEDMASTVKDRETLLRLQIDNPHSAALTRNTCSITMLQASSKINVVAPEASAQIDCRLLPDEGLDSFTEKLRRIINDPTIGIRRIMGFTPAVSSSDTELYRAIEKLIAKWYPEAAVIPSVATGFTDSHFFRDLGIVSYGFNPILLPVEEFSGVHGNNERVPVEQVKLGTKMTLELLLDFTRITARRHPGAR